MPINPISGKPEPAVFSKPTALDKARALADTTAATKVAADAKMSADIKTDIASAPSAAARGGGGKADGVDEQGAGGDAGVKVNPTPGSMEELIAAAGDDADLNPEAPHAGAGWAETLKKLDPEARKLLGNLRADYTRKMQGVADERKRLEQERTAFTRSDAYKQMVELAKKTDIEFDPYDPDKLLASMKQEIAKQLITSMEPVVQHQAAEDAKLRMELFVGEHKELKDDKAFKLDVAKELQSNDALTLEQAYWIVKGRRETATGVKREAELHQYRQAAKAAGLRVSTGGVQMPARPPKEVTRQGAAAIYRWVAEQAARSGQ